MLSALILMIGLWITIFYLVSVDLPLTGYGL